MVHTLFFERERLPPLELTSPPLGRHLSAVQTDVCPECAADPNMRYRPRRPDIKHFHLLLIQWINRSMQETIIRVVMCHWPCDCMLPVWGGVAKQRERGTGRPAFSFCRIYQWLDGKFIDNLIELTIVQHWLDICDLVILSDLRVETLHIATNREREVTVLHFVLEQNAFYLFNRLIAGPGRYGWKTSQYNLIIDINNWYLIFNDQKRHGITMLDLNSSV